jgi:hypothetical protein
MIPRVQGSSQLLIIIVLGRRNYMDAFDTSLFLASGSLLSRLRMPFVWQGSATPSREELSRALFSRLACECLDAIIRILLSLLTLH